MYVPPLLEALSLADLEHNPRGQRSSKNSCFHGVNVPRIAADFDRRAAFSPEVGDPGRVRGGSSTRADYHEPIAVGERLERDLAWLTRPAAGGRERDSHVAKGILTTGP